MRGTTESLLLSRLLWSSVAFGISLLLFWWRRIRRGDAYLTGTWWWGVVPLPTTAGFAAFGVWAFGFVAVLNLVLLVLSALGVDVASWGL